MARVEVEINGQKTVQHIIKLKKNTFTVYGNKRVEANNFNSFYHCDLCDPEKKKFIPKVIEIPGIPDFKICLGCIVDMEKAINTSTLEDCKKRRNKIG